jgi:hypothetical protein
MHLGLIVGAAPRYAREDTVQPQAETNKQDAPCESVVHDGGLFVVSCWSRPLASM